MCNSQKIVHISD